MNEPIFECANIPVAVVAKALKVDAQTVRLLIQQGVVNWGKCWKRPGSRHFSYLISPRLFYEETGVILGGDKE